MNMKGIFNFNWNTKFPTGKSPVNNLDEYEEAISNTSSIKVSVEATSENTPKKQPSEEKKKQ